MLHGEKSISRSGALAFHIFRHAKRPFLHSPLRHARRWQWHGIWNERRGRAPDDLIDLHYCLKVVEVTLVQFNDSVATPEIHYSTIRSLKGLGLWAKWVVEPFLI